MLELTIASLETNSAEAHGFESHPESAHPLSPPRELDLVVVDTVFGI